MNRRRFIESMLATGSAFTILPGANRFWRVKKPLPIVKGQLAVAASHNGRVYPAAVMEEAVRKFQQKIDSKTSFGHFYVDHRAPTHSPTSHLITKMEAVDNGFSTEVKILDTVAGSLLKDSLESGKILCSLSGVSEVDDQGNVKDLNLIGVDFNFQSRAENNESLVHSRHPLRAC